MKTKRPLVLQTALVQDNIPIQVYPNVWIGSIHAAFNREGIVSRNITHILNASGMPSTFPSDFVYLTLEIRDKAYSNILSCIPITNMFIQEAIDRGGGVLVHCAGGRSRSPALTIAYMMSTASMSFHQAHTRVKTCRPVVALNTGFETQLKALELCQANPADANQIVLQERLHQLQGTRVISKQPKPLVVRLTRPDAPSIEIIPPFRAFGCKKCHYRLFSAQNVIQHLSKKQPTLNNVKYNLTLNPSALEERGAALPTPIPRKTLVRRPNGESIYTFPSSPALRRASAGPSRSDRSLDIGKWVERIRLSGIRSSSKVNVRQVLSCKYCFIEPMEWMEPIDMSTGLISCPNESCAASIGAWNWAGTSCYCGAAIKPSFRIETNAIIELEQ